MKHKPLKTQTIQTISAWLLVLALLFGLPVSGLATSEFARPFRALPMGTVLRNGSDGLIQHELPPVTEPMPETMPEIPPVEEAPPVYETIPEPPPAQEPPAEVLPPVEPEVPMEPEAPIEPEVPTATEPPAAPTPYPVPEPPSQPGETGTPPPPSVIEVPQVPEATPTQETTVSPEPTLPAEITPVPSPPLTQAPSPSPSPLPMPEPPSHGILPPIGEVEGTPVPDFPPPVLTLGQIETPAVRPGETVLFALPIEVHYAGARYLSNLDAWQPETVPYAPGHEPQQYDQTIADMLYTAEITLGHSQPEGFPLDSSAAQEDRDIIKDGINYGYATIGPLRVPEDAAPGAYRMQVTLRWREYASAEEQALSLSVPFTVLAPELPPISGIMPPIGTVESTPPPDPTPVEVALGSVETPSALPGETLEFALPIDVLSAQMHYLSNLDAWLPETVPYAPENEPERYDQTLGVLLDMVEITLSENQPEGLPLDLSAVQAHETVVGEGINHGYAALENIRVWEDALPGDYAINITIRWRGELPDALEQTVSASVPFTVLAPPTLYTGMPWGDGIIVYSQSDLKQALQDGHSMIYLGYSDENQGNIAYTAAGGMPIRNSVTIDGMDPVTGRRMRLTDWKSSGNLDGMYVATAGVTVTLRNMDITGYNYYGIVYGSGVAGAHIAFENVTFTGRQMVHNRGANGSVSFRDTDVTITRMDTGSEEEVSETSAITFYGVNTMRRSGPQDHAMFYMVGGSAYSFTVTEGATLNLTTSDYMLYSEDSARTDVQIYGAVNLTTTGDRGSATYADQYIGTMAIHAGGALNISHQSGVSIPTLQVRNMTVGGTLILARASSGSPLIRVRGGVVQLNNPPLFSLYNPGGVLVRGADGSSMQWNTQVINRYSGGAVTAVWNNADMSTFTASFSVGGAGVRVTGVSGLESGAHGAALGAPALSGTAINFEADSRIMAGQRQLTLDTVYGGSRQVGGLADGGATQDIREYTYDGGVLGELLQQVSGVSGGRYRASMPSPLQQTGSRVYVISDNGILVAHTYKDPTPSGLSFIEVPSTMAFETVRLSGEDQIILRQDRDWAILVFDPRGDGNAFTVHARLQSPLTSVGGDVLEGSLVFIKDGTMAPLTQDDIPIASVETQTDTDTYTLQWNEDEGILLYLPAYAGQADDPYQASIVWTLVEGP